jgi:hypothetical protein
LGSQAFNRCANLAAVRLSESVSVIGRNAFGYCPKLERITIPPGVTSIQGNAFLNCSGLSEIIFRGDLPSIGAGALSGLAAEAVVYYTASGSGFDDPALDAFTKINLGHYSPFNEWLLGLGLNPALDPDADLNGDGVTLFESYAFNLNPLNYNGGPVQAKP